MKDSFTDVKGVKIRYFKQGNGTPLIILHGWGGVWPKDDPSLEILSQRFRVIIPDLPGYGGSQKLRSFHSIKNYATFLKDFLDTLGIVKTHLLGHSMGSLVAAVFTTLYPERVEKLILAGTDYDYTFGTPFFLRIPLKICLNIAQTKLGQRIFLLAIQNRILLRFLSFLIVTQIKKPRDQKPSPREWAEGFFDHSPHAMLENFLNVFSQNFKRYFLKLKVPTLLLYGKGDLLTPPHRQQEITTFLPKASLVQVKGAGHLMMWDKPKEFAKAVKDFLS